MNMRLTFLPPSHPGPARWYLGLLLGPSERRVLRGFAGRRVLVVGSSAGAGPRGILQIGTPPAARPLLHPLQPCRL